MPSSASTDSAAATLAVRASRSASARARAPSAPIIWVPLSRARPSLASRVRGSSPTSRRAISPGTTWPCTSAWPRPMSGRARWASGARSPDAPTLPCSGTTGWTPSRSRSSSRSTISGRQPLWPRARVLARSRSIARTTSRGKAGPTPAAWLIRRFSWRRPASAGGMKVVARSPKPVVTPYTTAPSATSDSMTSRASCMRSRAWTSSSAATPWRATASTSAMVRSAPVRMTGAASSVRRGSGSGSRCGTFDSGTAPRIVGYPAARVRLPEWPRPRPGDPDLRGGRLPRGRPVGGHRERHHPDPVRAGPALRRVPRRRGRAPSSR